MKNKVEVNGGSIVVDQRGREIMLSIRLPTRQDASAMAHAIIAGLESREEFSLVLQTTESPHD